MIRNGLKLLLDNPIVNMVGGKLKAFGLSWGLSEVGYDIRVRERIEYHPPKPDFLLEFMRKVWTNGIDYQMTDEDLMAFHGYTLVYQTSSEGYPIINKTLGKTALASSVEEFKTPPTLWGDIKNKSSHARRFFDASIGTDIEPGWNGFLTIEVVFHGLDPIVIEAGSPILKVVYHQVETPVSYNGKYQNQPPEPVEAIYEAQQS